MPKIYALISKKNSVYSDSIDITIFKDKSKALSQKTDNFEVQELDVKFGKLL